VFELSHGVSVPPAAATDPDLSGIDKANLFNREVVVWSLKPRMMADIEPVPAGLARCATDGKTGSMNPAVGRRKN
jgi:hypothetical protein